MSIYRVWIFRVLVAVSASLAIVSFIGPWWSAIITSELVTPGISSFVVNIYQWGIPESPGSEHFITDVTPFYQTVLAYIFLAASIGFIFFSTLLKGRKGKWLLGSIGLIWIGYAAIAAIWIAIRTGDYGISLQGVSLIQQPGEAEITASLRFGYYLAYVVGVMCIGLALIRDRITGTELK